MTDQAKKNFLYQISIHHLDNQFYVTSAVRMPPIGMSTQVLPLFIVPDNNREKFVEAIEATKAQSSFKFDYKEVKPDREEWDGDKGRVWNTAQKSWCVFWDEHGGVIIAFSKPYRKRRAGVEWIFVKDAEKNLPPPVSSRNIAQEIINQLQLK